MALSHVLNIIASAGAVTAGSNNLDSQAVTVGNHSQAFAGGSGLPANTSNYRGFFDNTYDTDGSISDGTSNLYSGASIVELFYTWNNVYGISLLGLRIDGASRANSGWTTLTINGTAFARTDATYTANSGGDTYWTWVINSPADLTGAQNPFPAVGQVATCVFT